MSRTKTNTWIEMIDGCKVKPGLYLLNGATPFKNGVNFTIHSQGAVSCELLLFRYPSKKPEKIIPIPESYRIGSTYSIFIYDLDIENYEYAYRFDGPYNPEKGLYFNKGNILLDPYARCVTGQSVWGKKTEKEEFYRGRVCDSKYEWGEAKQPEIPFKDLVIYEMHVRGFTKSCQDVEHPGTFAGIKEKIPYLLELGINAVELMPIFEFDEVADEREYEGKKLLDYWGYNPVCFFAPNSSYASKPERNEAGNELKDLVRELNRNGIEVILDVVFNHTAEGGKGGPFISFKGMDNNIYYMLTPNGDYYNFSGCGNTLNCNHPIVQQMILDCLRFWVIEYRIDGFRFDLASILGRSEDGAPLGNAPLLKSLAFDPILSKTKLIAEAWDAGGLYQVGTFPNWKHWSEWNGKYRDDMRRFLKGDAGFAQAAINRITGSRDLYDPLVRGDNASVNFLNCHDGYTLYDMYAYQEKHNEANGWGNTDGDNNNNSWNCGCEGETKDRNINELRMKMCKNAFALLLSSRGAAMFLAGDEFANSQKGNNNSYCQDSEISWLNWNDEKRNKELTDFVKKMILFRKNNPILRGVLKPSHTGWPDISIHNSRPWNDSCEAETRNIGIMFAGWDEEKQEENIVLLRINTCWEDAECQLPQAPSGMHWKKYIDTHSMGDLPDTQIEQRSVEIWRIEND